MTQRGNRRERVFFSPDDYRLYRKMLAQAAVAAGTEVWAYCLMPNHVHLILVPSHADSLRATLAEAHRRYTRFVNEREGWTGHLWQGRFGSVIASGWQIAALSMRLFVESGGYGETPMVGLGIDELRWRRPVKPGDILRVKREVVATERHKTRPEFGIIRTQVTVMNQKDETVMSLVSLGQVPSRPAEAEAGKPS